MHYVIRDCVIIIRRGGGTEKLELSSKNLDSTPPPKQKKLVLTPLCYVKNNVAREGKMRNNSKETMQPGCRFRVSRRFIDVILA